MSCPCRSLPRRRFVGPRPDDEPCLRALDRVALWGERVFQCVETGLVWEARSRGRGWDFRLTDEGLLTFYAIFVAGEVSAPGPWVRKKGAQWPPQWTTLLEQLRVLAYEPPSSQRDLVVCNILWLAELCAGPPNLFQYARGHGLVPRDAVADVDGARRSLLAARELEVGLRSLETAIPEGFTFSPEQRDRSLEDDLLDHTVNTVVLLALPRDTRGDRILAEHVRRHEPTVQRHWALIDRLIADVEEWLDSDAIDEHAGWLHSWADISRRLTLGQHVADCYLQDGHTFRLERCAQVASTHIGQLYDLSEGGVPFGMPAEHWWWFG